jgi:cbb3-type cytochrome oxidase maturation protein
MDILLLLIPLAVVLVLAIGFVFGWAVKSGQFDDLDAPARRILADDDGPPAATDTRPTLTGVKPVPREAP